MLRWSVYLTSVPGFISTSLCTRAGTIRSAAVSIRIRYRPCRYDTYSIRYTCIWLKVSKSIILYFNNKVNVLNRSIQWILQMLVQKHNDRFFPKNYKYNIFKIKLNMFKSFVYCMKIKCKTNIFESGIVVVFCSCHHQLYPGFEKSLKSHSPCRASGPKILLALQHNPLALHHQT